MSLARSLKILIIDDNPIDRETYCRYLLQDPNCDYSVMEAESGEEGLALCRQQMPDAILLDFLLPDLDGLEFLTELQAQLNGSTPAIVMLTGQGDESVAVRAMKLGVQDYLVKGRTSGTELLSTLNSAIANVFLRQELQRREAQLQESQLFIQQITDTTPGIVYVYDLVERRNVYINNQVFNILGYTAEQIQARGSVVLEQLMHPEDLARLPEHFQRLASVQNGEMVFEYRMRNANGKWHWFCTQDKVFKRTSDGSIHQVLGVALDITRRKQALEALEQQRQREQLVTKMLERIRESIHLEDILVTTVEEVRQFLKTDRALVFRLEPDGSGTVVAESVGSEWMPILSSNVYDPCFTHEYVKSYRQCRFSAIADIYTAGIDPCHLQLLAQFQVRANLIVPILHREQLWGLLIAHNCAAPRSWQPLEISLLQQLATQVGVALQQATLFEQLQRELIERRQTEVALRQSDEFSRSVFESCPDCAKVLDLDGRLLSMNALGQCVMEIDDFQPYVGAVWIEFWQGQEREAARQALAAALSGEIGRFYGYCPTAKGTPKWWDVAVTPILDEQGVPKRLLSVSRDITERKQAEAERDRLLEQEQAARAEAEAANRAKDEFVAIVSHDLRSPLNAILGWAKLLQTRKPDEATLVRALETIERNAQAQAKLIEDLLDISRMIRGKLELVHTQVDLVAIAKTAIATAYPTANAKQIHLELSLDTSLKPICGDPNRLQQVLGNLLSNAIKFTPQGGTIAVKLERVKGCAQITVSDTGCGIAAEFLPYVFECYRQADRSNRQGGLGLGLAIVRHIVELHGGTIQVTSPGEGQGATFTVNLPL